MFMAFVDDVLIDLVHDGVDVVFDAEVGDEFEFVIGEDFAAWIGWVADKDGLDARGLEGVFEDLGVEVECGWVEGDEDGFAVGHDCLGAIIFKVGRK